MKLANKLIPSTPNEYPPSSRKELIKSIKNNISSNERVLADSTNANFNIESKLSEVKLQAEESQKRTQKILDDGEIHDKENDPEVKKVVGSVKANTKGLVKKNKELQRKFEQLPVYVPRDTNIIIKIPKTNNQNDSKQDKTVVFKISSFFVGILSFVKHMGKSVFSFFFKGKK